MSSVDVNIEIQGALSLMFTISVMPIPVVHSRRGIPTFGASDLGNKVTRLSSFLIVVTASRQLRLHVEADSLSAVHGGIADETRR